MTVRRLTSGNDSFVAFDFEPLAIWGLEGADTIDATTTATGATIVGGLDSADAADLLLGSRLADFIYGNGGADSIRGNGGADTIVGGFGNDTIVADAAMLVWGNQGNDLINTFGASTVWGGQGNDTIICNEGAVYGNEGDDRLVASTAAAIVSGGSGADTFVLATSDVGRIADLDWSVDRIDVNIPDYWMPQRTAVLGTVSGETLAAAATAAYRSVAPVLINEYGEYYTESTAVQFDYWGRTYLTIGFGGGGMFGTTTPIDITGVTGAISTSNFI